MAWKSHFAILPSNRACKFNEESTLLPRPLFPSLFLFLTHSLPPPLSLSLLPLLSLLCTPISATIVFCVKNVKETLESSRPIELALSLPLAWTLPVPKQGGGFSKLLITIRAEHTCVRQYLNSLELGEEKGNAEIVVRSDLSPRHWRCCCVWLVKYDIHVGAVIVENAAKKFTFY